MGVDRKKKQAPDRSKRAASGTTSVFNTLDGFWSMWRAVSWLSSHKRFMSLGVVLAEYATRTALAYLPHDQEERYERLLALVGFDVREVGLATVGQTALSVAFTGAHFSHARRAESPSVPDAEERAALREAMEGIRRVSRMPATLEDVMHQRFASALKHAPAHTAAVLTYGPELAEWTRGGLYGLDMDNATATDYRRAYERWRGFCARAEALVDRWGEPALREAATCIRRTA